ncbi:MAG: hypothetical protein D3921_10970 [Candidatus Electrothrix sp. AW1]|nr:hypothetical protein [Candidatus Electrothrix gigas]
MKINFKNNICTIIFISLCNIYIELLFAPPAIALVFISQHPTNEDINTPIDVSLSWDTNDNSDEFNVFSYYVKIDKGNVIPVSIACANISETTCNLTSDLSCGIQYSWSVNAKDGQGAVTTSPIWTFTTSTCSDSNQKNLIPIIGLLLLKQSADTAIPTVTSLTGRVWMDRNLGASRVATSMDDAQAYGDLYQWGRLTDGHEKRNSSTTTTLSPTDVPGHGNFIVNTSEPYDWRTTPNNNLWQGEGGINNPCPSSFRLPTESELQAEVDSWSSKDAAGAFGSVLKLPSAGYRNFESGSLVYEAISGGYWTSTIDESQTDGHNIPSLFFNNSGYAGMSSLGHVLGGSVRCIQD